MAIIVRCIALSKEGRWPERRKQRPPNAVIVVLNNTVHVTMFASSSLVVSGNACAVQWLNRRQKRMPNMVNPVIVSVVGLI
jgi:hypothetical protein